MNDQNALLGELKAWFDDRQAGLATHGLTVRLGGSPMAGRDKSSLCLDIDSTVRLSQLILWSSGEAELQMAEVVSGEVVSQHRQITSRIELDDALETLLVWVSTAEG